MLALNSRKHSKEEEEKKDEEEDGINKEEEKKWSEAKEIRIKKRTNSTGEISE